MPQVLAFAAELAFDATVSFVGPGTAAIIGTSVIVTAEVAIAIGTGLTIAEALQTPTPEGVRISVRQAIPPRRRGVGVMRSGGMLVLEEANTTNDLYRVAAVVDGPGKNVSRWYLSQDRAYTIGDPFETTAGGVVVKMLNGGYTNNCVTIMAANGVAGTPAMPRIEGKCSWTTTDQGVGIFMIGYSAYGGSLQNFTTCYPRGKPDLNVVAQVGAAYDWRDSAQSQTDPTTWKNTTNPVVGWVHELWAFRGYDWALDIAPALSILTAEANVCDELVNFLNVLTQTTTYSGVGVSHVFLDQHGPLPPVGAAIYIGGQTLTVTSVGGFVESPTGSGYGGVQVNLSANLTVGVPAQFPIRWQATTSNPVTEPRYAVGGVWSASEREADTVKKFADACDGWQERRGLDGAVIIRCGHYYTPTVTIGPDEIISYTWDAYTQDGKVVNELMPAVVHPAFDYTQVDTTAIRDDDDIAVNGLSSQPFKPDFCQSNGQCMRLARRRLDKLLEPTQALTVKRSGLKMLGERFINLDFGGDLPAVVVERVGRTEIIDGGMAIRTQVRVVDPTTIDAWDCYSQEGDGPTGTSPAGGPGMLAPAAPTIDSVTATSTPLSSGGTGEFLTVVADPPAAYATRTDLTWQVQWQVSGQTTWSPRQLFVNQPAGTVTLTNIGPAPYGAPIIVQVAYQTGGGQLSDWATAGTPTLTTEGGATLTTEGGASLELDPS